MDKQSIYISWMRDLTLPPSDDKIFSLLKLYSKLLQERDLATFVCHCLIIKDFTWLKVSLKGVSSLLLFPLELVVIKTWLSMYLQLGYLTFLQPTATTNAAL